MSLIMLLNSLFIPNINNSFVTVTCCSAISISSTDPNLSTFWQTTYTQDLTFVGPGQPSAGTWPVYRRDANTFYYLAYNYFPGYTFARKWRIANDGLGLPHQYNLSSLAHVWLSNENVPCPRFITDGSGIATVTIECTTSKPL